MGRTKSLTRVGLLFRRSLSGGIESGTTSAVSDAVSIESRRLFTSHAFRGGLVKGMSCFFGACKGCIVSRLQTRSEHNRSYSRL